VAPSLFKIVDWGAISLVVTDQEPEPAWGEFFRSRGIGVKTADDKVTGLQGDKVKQLRQRQPADKVITEHTGVK
jgi:hypothetical protein